MTSSARWIRVRDLFERALDIDPAHRDAWMDREAARDPEIAAEVRSLLAHHTQAGSFLERPIAADHPEWLADEGGLQPGDTVGPYTIEAEAGRGGMGRVYRARDHRLGRTVALKALSPALHPDAAHRARLRREAQAAAALTHPGICTVYALEEFNSELFIVTEYVVGHTLRSEIQSGPRPSPGDIGSVARQLAAALAHAHSRGVTHRDLKPENVMRTVDGTVKILDFGLAVMEGPDGQAARITQTGMLIGTPAYMAPEQLKGQAPDPRSDVFAFGALLYEFASGVHPFQAETPLAMIGRVLESDPVPIAVRNPAIPPSVAAVIDGALRKAPTERFAGGNELLRALENRDTPPTGRPLTSWWRAHQAVAIALYFLACFAAWQIKEWLPGVATALFVAAAVVCTIAGIFRGHLLFVERVNRPQLHRELGRALTVTLAADLVLALILAVDGLQMAGVQPLTGVLTIALGVGIALARLVLEPPTTAGALR